MTLEILFASLSSLLLLTTTLPTPSLLFRSPNSSNPSLKMGLFSRRRGSASKSTEPASLSVQTDNTRARADSTTNYIKEEHSANQDLSNRSEKLFHPNYRPSASNSASRDAFSTSGHQSVRTTPVISSILQPPTPPLSPNPTGLSRTAHWFVSTPSATTTIESSSDVEIEIEELGGFSQGSGGDLSAEDRGSSLSQESRERRGSISSLASITSINGINISRIFKINSPSSSDLPSKSGLTTSPYHSQETSLPSSPPLSHIKAPPSDLQIRQTPPSMLFSASGSRSDRESPSMPQEPVFSAKNNLAQDSQNLLEQASTKLSRVRTKSTHRGGDADGKDIDLRRRAPASPAIPSSRARRSGDFGRSAVEPRAESDSMVPLPLRIMADKLLEPQLNWESRLALVVEWVSQPKSSLRAVAKEKGAMSKRLSTWQNKKTVAKYTSPREEMELLEIYLTEAVLREMAQGRSNQQIESMRLGSVFREARQMTALQGHSKFRIFSAVKDDNSVVIGASQQPRPNNLHHQTSTATANPAILGPTMVLDDASSFSKAQAFGIVSLTPAPRRRKRPTTAPERRKNFDDLPPSPQFNQTNKTSYEGDQIARSPKDHNGMSPFKTSRFSNDSFGNTSDCPSQSASSNCDSSISHSNLRQLSLTSGDYNSQKLAQAKEAQPNMIGLEAPFPLNTDFPSGRLY